MLQEKDVALKNVKRVNSYITLVPTRHEEEVRRKISILPKSAFVLYISFNKLTHYSELE